MIRGYKEDNRSIEINYSNLIRKKVIVLYRHDGLADLTEAYLNKQSNIKINYALLIG